MNEHSMNRITILIQINQEMSKSTMIFKSKAGGK